VHALAFEAINLLLKGQDPNQIKRQERAQSEAEGITLAQALERYLEAVPLAEGTQRNYRTAVNLHLKDWRDLPISSISPAMVNARHAEIARTYPAAANTSMRVLRAVHRFIRDELSDAGGDSPIPESPTRQLRRRWTRQERRTSYIKPHQLKVWWLATEKLPELISSGYGEMARDYFQFVALCGCRRNEVLDLEWDDIDFKDRSYLIRAPKNKRPVRMPLTTYGMEIIRRRHDATGGKAKPFDFVEVWKYVQILKRESGIDHTVHDLRRGYATYAETLDLGYLTIKALLNHTVSGADVTSGYVRLDTERLRGPAEKIAAFILRHAGVLPSDVVDIEETK